MEKCPFWSTEKVIELCDRECPMAKLEEGCIFQLYYGDEENCEEKEDVKQFSRNK